MAHLVWFCVFCFLKPRYELAQEAVKLWILLTGGSWPALRIILGRLVDMLLLHLLLLVVIEAVIIVVVVIVVIIIKNGFASVLPTRHLPCSGQNSRCRYCLGTTNPVITIYINEIEFKGSQGIVLPNLSERSLTTTLQVLFRMENGYPVYDEHF